MRQKHGLDLNINKLGKEQSWEVDSLWKNKWIESESEGSFKGWGEFIWVIANPIWVGKRQHAVSLWVVRQQAGGTVTGGKAHLQSWGRSRGRRLPVLPIIAPPPLTMNANCSHVPSLPSWSWVSVSGPRGLAPSVCLSARRRGEASHATLVRAASHGRFGELLAGGSSERPYPVR